MARGVVGDRYGSFSAAYHEFLSVSFLEKSYISANIVSRGGIESSKNLLAYNLFCGNKIGKYQQLLRNSFCGISY